MLIIKHILDDPKIKRTRLAQKCNRNYHQMILYLEWMTLMKIIVIEERDKKTFVKITEYGKEIFYKTKTLTTGISL